MASTTDNSKQSVANSSNQRGERFQGDPESTEFQHRMLPNRFGDWVRYTDYEAVRAERDSLHRQLLEHAEVCGESAYPISHRLPVEPEPKT